LRGRRGLLYSDSMSSLSGRAGPWLVTLLLAAAVTSAQARPAAPLPPRTRVVAADAVRPTLPAPLDPGATALPILVQGGTAAGLRAAGATVRLQVGDVWVAAAPAPALPALAAVAGVRRVDAGYRLRPLLDRSAPLVGATAARTRFAVAGEGVVVGIVDTGVDTRHADFRNPDGSTRVRYLLDLGGAPTGAHPDLEAAYGAAVYDAADIDAWLAAGDEPPTTDTFGHGTHVASIAAGNGAATRPGSTPGRYVGIAPDADLVIVKATRGDDAVFTDADVVLGARFVFDVAARLGLPAVVNLSLGGQGGPHDGSTTLEQALAALLDGDPPGRAVVVAAGNDGSTDMHASGSRPYGGRDTLLVDIADYQPREGADEYVYLEVWYPAGTAQTITLVSPGGYRFGPLGPGLRLVQASDDGHVTIEVDPQSGDGVWAGAGVRVRKLDRAAPAPGRWRLELTGTVTRWDAWLAEDTLGEHGAAVFGSHLDPDLHLAIPAMAEPLIAVGSFVSRNEWVTVDGLEIQRGSVPGRASWFTATGPTADGRCKPDLAAPGDFIIAALSADAYPMSDTSAFFVAGEPHYLWADDGVHGVLRGTSQAAPHVAGAAALLLAAEPRLRASEVREALRLTASTDADTVPGRGFSPRFGSGKLDVLTALALVRGATPGPVSAARSTVGVSRDLLPPGSHRPATVVVVPKDSAGLPLGRGHAVTITAPGATFTGPVVDTGTGRYLRRLLAGPRGEAAELVASVDGIVLDARPRVFYVDRREEIAAPVVTRAGGCRAGATAPAPGAAALALLLGLGLAARRRRRRGAAGYSCSCSRNAK
jgi:MYXO-CTERM domain-containing protein